jgi:hypothetical protein
MDTSKMTGEINHDRRRFLGAAGGAALAVGAAQLGTIGAAKAQTSRARAAGLSAFKAGTNTSFGPVKQINAGVLNVGYVEAVPADGHAVVLMRGFPYDKAENAWWYQYYFDTERGVLGLTGYCHEFGEFVWTFNSPTWHFSTATYNQSAAAFNNPDYVAISMGNYRWRQSLYPSEPEYASIENQLQNAPDIAVPSITVGGEYDPFTPAGNGSAYRDKFTG